MRESRPKFSEQEIVEALATGDLSLGPFDFAVEASDHEGVDVVLCARSKERGLTRRFACVCRREWTRQSVAQAVEKLRSVPKPHLPLVVFPYLSEEQLDELRVRGVSGLDLCGNGLIFDPPRLFVLRTGAKKTFKITSTSPTVYQSRNVASLVARVFLTQPLYPTSQAVLETCHAQAMPLVGHNPPLVLPTVSKALKQLEQDLVITRRGREVRLQDADRLLTSLARYFRRIQPPDSGRFLGKTALASDAIWPKLRDLRPRIRVVVTGRGSAGHYTGLGGPDRLQLYASDVPRVVAALAAKPTHAFPNLEIIEAHEEGPYFDAREQKGATWSSPVQTFLEMSSGTAREIASSHELRARIFGDVEALPK